ncbi:MAG: hypothetical protein Q8922_12535 [Bacteroidota bacterium]|nr:hypothetical protein [Bacteroidota bacterium]MDP4232222.1 hypothetical protein [Bacteroidota bacterium]MDP4288751.1 hypothetical protein [Bacteroidota bacterium]
MFKPTSDRWHRFEIINPSGLPLRLASRGVETAIVHGDYTADPCGWPPKEMREDRGHTPSGIILGDAFERSAPKVPPEGHVNPEESDWLTSFYIS